MMHDILIRGGILYDGAGNPGVAGDLAITDGRIAAIGPRIAGAARKIIDAQNLAVAPGFIDIKTHSDFTLPINPKAESKVRQGVTTEIIGHCGFSVAPALPGKVELLKDYLSPSAPWLPFRESSFPDYLRTFPPTAVNAGMLVGHNTLRLMVMGMAERAPSAAELEQMIALLEDALAAGALGLSSGLFTPPGSYAEPAEMIALGHVLKRHNAGYFTHLRDESNKVIEAVAEAIEVGEQCGVHVEIVHFKCSGMDNWGKAAQALAMIADAKARGVDVDCDSYPYAAGSNPLKNILPPWVQAGGVEAMIARLGHARNAAKNPRRHRPRRLEQLGPHSVVGLRADLDLAASAAIFRPHHCVARRRARRRSDRHVVRLSRRRPRRDPRAGDVDRGSRHPHHRRLAAGAWSAPTAIASRPTAPSARACRIRASTAPFRASCRAMCATRTSLPLPLAIHKMTGATARALKLKDRGLLREGFCADVVIFDPEDFVDRATYADPHQFPSGARTTVIVNGTLVVENATHTGALPGKVLRRDAAGGGGLAALGFPMARTLVARRAATPGAFAVIARQPAGAGRALAAGPYRDADLAASVDQAVHVETRIVVVNSAVGDAQRIAVAAVAAAGIGDDRNAPIAVELRDGSRRGRRRSHWSRRTGGSFLPRRHRHQRRGKYNAGFAHGHSLFRASHPGTSTHQLSTAARDHNHRRPPPPCSGGA